MRTKNSQRETFIISPPTFINYPMILLRKKNSPPPVAINYNACINSSFHAWALANSINITAS
ncbi:hypothetical protein A4R26_27300 [Niastella populi]|uniref:Uncharacterized protein n=1 Tax=Niastella populi TaxID=550983 RepID=A0A1V9F8G6_9BACT|nr:hypothetical protein A4R26_27300 [Niastella populi]